MFNQNLAIVDIETTGMSAQKNRIIEIAVIRVEKNKIVDKFNSLINPEVSLPYFISYLTGITEDELDRAPVFGDVYKKVDKLLKDATFVAHNVWFDYSFIQSEMDRINNPFESKKCCTVRLSRRLYPEHRSHSLQSIISRYDFATKRRHRAYDDAFILWKFLQKIKKEFPKEYIQETWEKLSGDAGN